MFGLTPLGVVHTAIGLVAVVCGFWALWRHREISFSNTLGKTYVYATLITAATGLGIFQHGGFGPPHVLSILTLVALLFGTACAVTSVFGRASRYLQALAFSTTILFHMIPGFTESLTRLPLGAPLLASADAPELKPIFGVLLVLLVVGLILQIRWLRAGARL